MKYDKSSKLSIVSLLLLIKSARPEFSNSMVRCNNFKKPLQNLPSSSKIKSPMPSKLIFIGKKSSVSFSILFSKNKVVVLPYCLGLFIIKYSSALINFIILSILFEVSTI